MLRRKVNGTILTPTERKWDYPFGLERLSEFDPDERTALVTTTIVGEFTIMATRRRALPVVLDQIYMVFSPEDWYKPEILFCRVKLLFDIQTKVRS